jgi:hypothetical protein
MGAMQVSARAGHAPVIMRCAVIWSSLAACARIAHSTVIKIITSTKAIPAAARRRPTQITVAPAC